MGIYTPAYGRMRHRMREAREAAGLTQASVAASLGRPQSYVSKIESGERRIDPVELQALARLYRRPLLSFLDTD